nr:hypothetical protein [uncultured Fluviicola sp.]
MSIRVETEQTYGFRDRKIAGIIAFTAFVLLAALLGFIGYHISNPPLPKQLASEEMTLIPLDAQILEQGRKDGGSGTPAKAEKSRMTPQQMDQILTQQNSTSHAKSGNSNITNTHTPNNNPSNAKYVSDNPFATGGINEGKYGGENNTVMHDNQDSDSKLTEKVNRFLIKTPNTTNIKSDENCKIVLAVLVDPNGTIIGSPAMVKGSSTTNNMALVNQVIGTVKNQAKFNKVDATKNTKETIAIRIIAN